MTTTTILPNRPWIRAEPIHPHLPASSSRFFFFFSAPANLLITKSLCSSPSALPIFSLNITQAQLQGPLLGGDRHELHLVAVIAVQPDKRDVLDKFSAKFPPRPTIVPLCRQKVLPVSGIYVSSFGAALGTASRARFPDQDWADRVLARPNGLKFELEQQVELAQTFVLVWIFVGAGDGDVEAAACGEEEVRAGACLVPELFHAEFVDARDELPYAVARCNDCLFAAGSTLVVSK
ncbi:hypothetical protein B0J12DRAFT_669086 [Macrophomina phaseolina]|uniref:Uncharacterized protein n=1 Tax=Macrophomina phaseolina TaxID=35725 RepID=A0ABQ8G6W5_9PEZI|nr:hypothetical protein B0J12DRAFT_669086 [Macrophomina phaseolina]